MQFDGGNGGVDTRPPAPDQTAHYSFDSAPQSFDAAAPAGWWEQRDRHPAALWVLLGGAALVGIILLVAYVTLTSSGETVTGPGEGGDAAAADVDSEVASPTAEVAADGAESETAAPSTADSADPSAATEDGDAMAEEQPEPLAVTATPDAANNTPAAPAETTTTAVATTVTTAPPVTDAPTTQAPATDAPTTQAPTTEAPTTEAPTTQAPTTEAPTTDAPTTEAPAAEPPTTEAPTTTTMPPATEAPTTQPPATEAPPTAAEPAGNDAAAQQQVLDLTNAERANAGCPALQLNQTLNVAADGHSEDMAARNYFSHNDPEGNGPGVRIDAAGYQGRGWGENIAAGYRSAAAVVEGWMNSDGHRRNILNCNFNELGVGYAEGGSYGVYWTQVFGTR